MTKQEILEAFDDIDVMYNDSSRLDTLSRMIDKLLEERNTTNICHIVNARVFSCKKCGYGLNDLYLTNEHDYPFVPAYCPNCGRKVIS